MRIFTVATCLHSRWLVELVYLDYGKLALIIRTAIARLVERVMIFIKELRLKQPNKLVLIHFCAFSCWKKRKWQIMDISANGRQLCLHRSLPHDVCLCPAKAAPTAMIVLRPRPLPNSCSLLGSPISPSVPFFFLLGAMLGDSDFTITYFLLLPILSAWPWLGWRRTWEWREGDRFRVLVHYRFLPSTYTASHIVLIS